MPRRARPADQRGRERGSAASTRWPARQATSATPASIGPSTPTAFHGESARRHQPVRGEHVGDGRHADRDHAGAACGEAAQARAVRARCGRRGSRATRRCARCPRRRSAAGSRSAARRRARPRGCRSSRGRGLRRRAAPAGRSTPARSRGSAPRRGARRLRAAGSVWTEVIRGKEGTVGPDRKPRSLPKHLGAAGGLAHSTRAPLALTSARTSRARPSRRRRTARATIGSGSAIKVAPAAPSDVGDCERVDERAVEPRA